MRYLPFALAGLVIAGACSPAATSAAPLTATPATLAAIVSKAEPGDVISLAPGDYGDAYLRGRNFTAPVTITSADTARPAHFRTLAIVSMTDIVIRDINVELTPDAKTQGHTPALRVANSSRVLIDNVRIKGSVATIGIDENTDRDAPRNTVNVIGRPTARGISIEKSSDVTIEGSEISQHLHGIVVTGSDITIRGNKLHHMRKSFILGTAERLRIEGNHLYSPHPWNYGGNGDHGDFIALWGATGQTAPAKGIRIVNNLLEQGDGAPFIGMLIGSAPGFADMEITDNVLLMTGAQGIALMNVNGIVARNVMFRTGGTPKDAPSILLRGTSNVVVENNVLTDTYQTIAKASGPSTFKRNKVLSNGVASPTELEKARSAWQAVARPEAN
jgi:parallel beta-helix repeat protein